MLCRAGNIGKRDIGTIKMMPGETYVEIHASAADGFTAALGPKMLIEDKLRVKKLDARPDMSRSGPREAGHRDERPQGDFKKPDWKKKGDYAGKSDGGKPYKGKSFDGKPGGLRGSEAGMEEEEGLRTGRAKPGKPLFPALVVACDTAERRAVMTKARLQLRAAPGVQRTRHEIVDIHARRLELRR